MMHCDVLHSCCAAAGATLTQDLLCPVPTCWGAASFQTRCVPRGMCRPAGKCLFCCNQGMAQLNSQRPGGIAVQRAPLCVHRGMHSSRGVPAGK
jgi:hypothetical protein